MIKLLLSAGNECSRSYREINQHPSLLWNFITHGFLDPAALPDRHQSPKSLESVTAIFGLLLEILTSVGNHVATNGEVRFGVQR